jgi:AcrR family transcriptional regulator
MRPEQTIDRRAARTEKALHKALISLILDKGYEPITVQDIIDRADVGRSTFYAHFTGKEDLLKRGFEMLRRELAEAQRAAASGRAGSRKTPLAFSLAMFEHAYAHKDVYLALVGGRGAAVVLGEIRRVLCDFVQKELGESGDDALPRAVRVQFVVGTFLTMLTWWLERKPKLSPAEVNAMFRRLVLEGIGG